jgi:BirA family transcriptional regulator, biotin operon repressor / biotin---[acetyl-CoA-carboxylase] ligase
MLALATNGSVREGDWLIAQRQTAGRGRQGRAWVSPTGNLYTSGLVELRDSEPPASTLALVAGVAVIEALGLSAQTLKWPNDILVGNAKLAGVLLERHNSAVVVGVGVNLSHHPDLPDRPATNLLALGVTMSADTAIAALAPSFARWLGIWRTAGLPAIRTAWLDRAHPIGTALSAALPDGTRLEGGFDGLTPDCALQLRLADGTTRVIHAGDVFLI